MNETTQETSVLSGWREQSLELMLRWLRWIVPAAATAALTLRPNVPFDHPVTYLYIAVSAMFVVLPSLRLTSRQRAWMVVTAMTATGATTLVPWGLLPGPPLLFIVACLFAAVFLGRNAALAVIGAIPILYLGVGLGVVNGVFEVNNGLTNPLQLANWMRVCIVVLVFASFVGVVIYRLILFVERGHGALSETNRELQELLDASSLWHSRIELAKDEERRQLSRELHDELGQTLTALGLRISVLTRSEATSGQAQSQLGEAKKLVDSLLARVRKISVDLRPPLLDELGIESALQASIQGRGQSGPACTLETSGLSERLPAEIEMTVFRVVQEAITNAVRHADARSLRVEIHASSDELTLSVLDDGRGVSNELARQRARAGHLGLVGMRERVRALGGDLQLSSPPRSGEPSGTRIDVRLPLRPLATPALS